MTYTRHLDDLHRAWSNADDKWMHELERAFPRRWPGDLRYTPKARGLPGTPLRAAYEAYTAAREAFYRAGGAEWLQGLLVPSPITQLKDKLREEIAATGDC